MKDEDFKLLGFDDKQINRQTDICDCRVTFATDFWLHRNIIFWTLMSKIYGGDFANFLAQFLIVKCTFKVGSLLLVDISSIFSWISLCPRFTFDSRTSFVKSKISFIVSFNFCNKVFAVKLYFGSCWSFNVVVSASLPLDSSSLKSFGSTASKPLGKT